MFIIILIIISLICLIVVFSKKSDNSVTDYSTDSDIEHSTETRTGVSGERIQVDVKKTLSSSETQTSGMISMTKSTWDVTENYNNYEPKPHRGLKPAAYYKVRGRNTATNRMKGAKVYAYDKDDAIERAKSQGLTDPFTVEYMDDNNPTTRQIECLRRNNIKMPVGATKDDISNILGVLFDEAEPIKQSTIDYVVNHNIVISPYSTEDAAQWEIAKQKNK